MPRLDGVDVSVWQGAVNWDLVAAARLEFVCLQVGATNEAGQRSRNELAIDAQYRRNIRETRARQAATGWEIVHYYVPANRPPKEQLDWLLDTTGPLGPRETLMFDVEYEDAKALGFEAIVAMVRDAQQRVGRQVLWYGGGYFPTEPSWIEHDSIADIPKWFAAYSSEADMRQRHAAGVESLVLWQWGGSAEGAFVPGIHGGAARVDSNQIIDRSRYEEIFGLTGGDVGYIAKAAWGGKPKLWDGGTEQADRPYVFLHHSGDFLRQLGQHEVAATFEAEAAHLRALQDDAQRPKTQGGQGYSDVDFNLAVGPSGRVYEGRGWYERAGATKDMNDQSYAIVLLGDYDPSAGGRNVVTAPQTETVIKVIRDGIARGRLLADVQILGHTDNPAHPGVTPCPGSAVMAVLDHVRRGVAARGAMSADEGTGSLEEDDVKLAICIDRPVNGLNPAFILGPRSRGLFFDGTGALPRSRQLQCCKCRTG